jgi:hypothetical protein
MALVRLLAMIRMNLPYLLLGACILEGGIALLAMFTFPPLAIAMVFIGLFSLAVTPLIRWVLQGTEALLVRVFDLDMGASDES